MKYQLIGKNVTVTEGMASAIKNKLDKMDKYFSNDDVDCRVVTSTHGEMARLEVTIYLPKIALRAEVENQDLYAAIDLALDKLEGQMRKLKTRMDRSNGKISLCRSIEFDSIEEEKESGPDEIVRTKSYYLTPMSIEEAVARMEALGHDFFMYLDEEDERVSVVYLRKDGGYGVIQAENQVK